MAHQVLSLVPIMRPGLGTFSVDKYMRMYWDPAFALEKTKDELAFIVLHEAMHPLLMHHLRFKGLVGETANQDQIQAWNWAGDCCINESLVKSGLTCPEEGILPRDLQLPPNGTLEEYYRILMDRAEQKKPEPQPQQGQQGQDQDQGQDEDENEDGQDGQKPPEDEQGGEEGEPDDGGQGGEPGEDEGDQEGEGQGGEGEGEGQGEGEPQDGGDSGQGQGQGGDGGEGTGLAPGKPYTGQKPNREQGQGGSGADGIEKPWEMPPDKTAMDQADQEMIRRLVAQQAEEFDSKGRGFVPGELLRMADQILHPRVDPVKELQARVRVAITSSHGFGDFTYKKRPRRSPPGTGILPAHVCPQPNVVVVVDTSGSMDKTDLGLALGTIERVCKGLPNSRGVRVLCGDTDVASAKNVFRPQQVELAGGGGTDMSMMIAKAMEEKPVPNVILVVTDGYTGWPYKPVEARVVVALTRASCKDRVPKWMDTVVIEQEKR